MSTEKLPEGSPAGEVELGLCLLVAHWVSVAAREQERQEKV